MENDIAKSDEGSLTSGASGVMYYTNYQIV